MGWWRSRRTYHTQNHNDLRCLLCLPSHHQPLQRQRAYSACRWQSATAAPQQRLCRCWVDHQVYSSWITRYTAQRLCRCLSATTTALPLSERNSSTSATALLLSCIPGDPRPIPPCVPFSVWSACLHDQLCSHLRRCVCWGCQKCRQLDACLFMGARACVTTCGCMCAAIVQCEQPGYIPAYAYTIGAFLQFPLFWKFLRFSGLKKQSCDRRKWVVSTQITFCFRGVDSFIPHLPELEHSIEKRFHGVIPEHRSGALRSSIINWFREILKTFELIPIFDPKSEFLEMAEALFIGSKLGTYWSIPSLEQTLQSILNHSSLNPKP